MKKESKSRKYLNVIFSGLFFIICIVLINNLKIAPPMISPTQVVGSSITYIIEGITRENLAVQEVILTKDYLQGIELRLTNFKRINTNDNVFLVLDSSYNVLFRDRFSSGGISDGEFHPFKFNQRIKTGKGNKIYLCLYSENGDKDNCISVLYNPAINAGKLYVCKIINNDLLGSIHNKALLYPGSMIMRIYESDTSGTGLFKLLFYLLTIAGCIVIIFIKRIAAWISRYNLKPESAFLVLSLVFGSMMVFVTPPLQAPDEAVHLERAYMISEGKLSTLNQKFPASLARLDGVFARLIFNPDAKTSKEEILSMMKIKLEPTKRGERDVPPVLIPYIPQATGIFFGRIFGAPPLILLYLGRIMNLLASILIIWFAIKMAPFFKWIFFLIGMMPKTLSQFASVSKDGFTISASLLLISIFLFYAFGKKERLETRDFIKILFFSLLSTLSKIPNIVLVFLFLLIPVNKIGSLRKYLAAFLITVIIVFIPFISGSVVREMISEIKSISRPGHPVLQESKISQTPVNIAKQADTLSKKEIINSRDQIKYILNDIPRFIKLEVNTTFSVQRKALLTDFIGVLGWLDTYLPGWLTNSYLIILLLAALLGSEPGIKIGWKSKLVLLLIFITAVFIIETGMYLAATTVGSDVIYGIQGRYFIQFAPLFLMLIFNQYSGKKMNFAMSLRRGEYNKAKINVKPRIYQEILYKEQIFTRTFNFCLIIFSIIASIVTIYTLELRYYSW